MIVILSPSKTLDTDSPSRTQECSKPDFLKESKLLVSELQSYSANDLAKLMKVSDSIANLNVERFHNWRAPFNLKNAKQAMLMFKGDVFSGLDAETFTPKDDTFAQEHLRILSGLYGVLRPLDLMQPYRLEMGTKLTTDRGNTLYTFWGDLVTQKLNEEFLEVKSKYLINLASNEYYKVINPSILDAEVITPIFKDKKSGSYKVIALFAKKARGLMARFIVKNRLKTPKKLIEFSEAGYRFDEKSSTDNEFVFLRDHH